MMIECLKCGHLIHTDEKRIPPWCVKCGADLKKPKVVIPSQPSGVQPSAKPGPEKLAGKAKPAPEKVVTIECPQCAHQMSVHDKRFPPWCMKCGADIKATSAVTTQGDNGVQPAETIDRPGNLAVEETPTLGHLRTGEDLADRLRAEHLEKERRERFSAQNILVGLGLAAWGFFMSGVVSGGAKDPTDKILAAHPELMTYLNWLQMLTCFNGIVLCASGFGVRDRKPWGYITAGVCAVFLIAVGLFFFVVFNKVGSGKELEDGVAKVRIIRENFDMLIGLVEGVFLLFFLYRHGAAPPPDDGTITA